MVPVNQPPQRAYRWPDVPARGASLFVGGCFARFVHWASPAVSLRSPASPYAERRGRAPLCPSEVRPLQIYVIPAKAGRLRDGTSIQRGQENGGLPDFHSVRCPPMGFAKVSVKARECQIIASSGIPRGLASLARVPLRFAKGTGALCPSGISPA